jgi:hypothetical protein
MGSWLMDPELIDARVNIQQTVNAMATCEQWSSELDAWWHDLVRVSTASPALARGTSLGSSRLEADAALGQATEVWSALSSKLELQLDILQRVGGKVLDKWLASDATGPPTAQTTALAPPCEHS